MTDRQPIWRRDFPYTAVGEEEVTRREFTRYLVLASAAFAGAGGLISLWASLRTVETGDPAPVVALEDLPVEGSYLFNYPGPDDPAILVRPAEDVILGFSQKCTHLGCVVFWVADDEEFHCPCHEGYFDLKTGRNIAGPPPRPLPKIALSVEGDDIYAIGVDERTV